MPYSASIIVKALAALIFVTVLAVILGGFGSLAGCAPPKTAADAEECRLKVDAAWTPRLVQEALAACPKGGTIATCLSPASIAAYDEAVKSCRESK